jgi:flavin reductase (DIM6/NTAB) family NADH-FMN oxidoreductase RutF
MFTTTTIIDETCHKQPRPTALLSVEENFMPLSWQTPISKSPMRYAVCVRDENKSYDLLHVNREFALNFLDYSYIEAYDKSGRIHGSDKFSLTGLTRKEARYISSSLIEEAYMIYECKVVDIISYGDHDVFIADVILIHNKKVKDVKPTLFLGQGYYETATQKPKRVLRKNIK